MGLFSILLGLIGCEKKKESPYTISETYIGLRNLVFELDPKTIGANDLNKPIYAILMETGFTDAVATLVALSDGAVSLYFSNGGGIIGFGQYEKPQRISIEYLCFANKFVDICTKAQDRRLPEQGQVLFYIFTIDKGVLLAEAKEEDLEHNKHSLSPLFYKAQELIAAMREVDEDMKNNRDK